MGDLFILRPRPHKKRFWEEITFFWIVSALCLHRNRFLGGIFLKLVTDFKKKIIEQ